MSRLEFLFGGAEARRTGGWLVVGVGLGGGGGMVGAGVGGYSAICPSDFDLVFIVGVFGGGAFLRWPGCAIEFPSALKKSPSDPASARGATSKAAAIRRTKSFGKERLIRLSRRSLMQVGGARNISAFCEKTNHRDACAPNRRRERKSMRWRDSPSSARSAAISPMTGANLNPWPENPPQRITFA